MRRFCDRAKCRAPQKPSAVCSHSALARTHHHPLVTAMGVSRTLHASAVRRCSYCPSALRACRPVCLSVGGRLAPRISARDRVTPRLHTRGCGAPGLNSTSLNRDLINREGSFYVLALDSFSRLRSPLGRLGGGPTVPNKVLTVGDIGGVPYHARTSDRTHEAYL